MEGLNSVARRERSSRRAFLYVCLIGILAAPAWAADGDANRVAAIISTDKQSMVLVEEGAGEQNWYGVGDFVGDSLVVRIDPEWITLSKAGSETRLYLRDDKKGANSTLIAAPLEPPPREVSRDYNFVNLISRVDSATPKTGESHEQAVGRKLNEVFGLADAAKITSVGGVEVSTAAEARAELSGQLRQGQPIRVMIDNAHIRQMYVTPEQ